jgi:hypothetical protein
MIGAGGSAGNYVTTSVSLMQIHHDEHDMDISIDLYILTPLVSMRWSPVNWTVSQTLFAHAVRLGLYLG